MSRMKTQYCELPDIKIAYHQFGEGSPLILLHGNSESKKIFRKYQQKYFPLSKTIAMDSRGHGQSVSIDSAYSIEQYSNDVISFCAKQNISEAFLVGYSDGGNVALFLAKNAPALFKKIVVIAPNYLANGLEESTLLKFAKMRRQLQMFRRFGLPLQKQIMRLDLMLNDIGLSKQDLSSIRANIKILYAEREMIKEDHLQEIAELIPNAVLRKISGCTHLNIVNQRETISEIKRFIES